MDWYFTVTSEEYGGEEYGPYDSEEEADVGIANIKMEAERLNDGVMRAYSFPEQREDD